jgi:hypothetical protein
VENEMLEQRGEPWMGRAVSIPWVIKWKEWPEMKAGLLCGYWLGQWKDMDWMTLHCWDDWLRSWILEMCQVASWRMNQTSRAKYRSENVGTGQWHIVGGECHLD